MLDFSVLIPCKNEIDHIEYLLDKIFNQSAFKRFSGEVIVIDGNSNDGTAELLVSLKKDRSGLMVLNNPLGYVSPALNLGIDVSKGKYIIRMDAHADYPLDYISSLLDYMEENPDVDNVGYVINTVPSSDTLVAHSIAHVLSHKYGVGSALFRLNISTPMIVDTVPFGCFRREVFERLGNFDVELIRNQDDEFNGRIINAGGKIILLPGMKITYFPRDSFSKLWSMYYQYGLFKPLTVAKLKKPATIRQLVPPVFVIGLLSLFLLSLAGVALAKLGLVFTLSLYFMLSVIATKDIAEREYVKTNNIAPIKYWPYVLSALFITHFSYGYGYWMGMRKMLLGSSIVSVKSSR